MVNLLPLPTFTYPDLGKSPGSLEHWPVGELHTAHQIGRGHSYVAVSLDFQLSDFPVRVETGSPHCPKQLDLFLACAPGCQQAIP